MVIIIHSIIDGQQKVKLMIEKVELIGDKKSLFQFESLRSN